MSRAELEKIVGERQIGVIGWTAGVITVIVVRVNFDNAVATFNMQAMAGTEATKMVGSPGNGFTSKFYENPGLACDGELMLLSLGYHSTWNRVRARGALYLYALQASVGDQERLSREASEGETEARTFI